MFTNLDATVVRFVNQTTNQEIQTFGIPSTNYSTSIFIPTIGEHVNLDGQLFRVTNIIRAFPTYLNGNFKITIYVVKGSPSDNN